MSNSIDYVSDDITFSIDWERNVVVATHDLGGNRYRSVLAEGDRTLSLKAAKDIIDTVKFWGGILPREQAYLGQPLEDRYASARIRAIKSLRDWFSVERINHEGATFTFDSHGELERAMKLMDLAHINFRRIR